MNRSSASDLLQHLKAMGVPLSLSKGSLQLSGSKHLLNLDIRREIERLEDDLVQLLSVETNPRDVRLSCLQKAGYNVDNLAPNAAVFNAFTDSWSDLLEPWITQRITHLSGQLPQQLDPIQQLQQIFRLPYVVPVSYARTAEAYLFTSLADQRNLVVQNILSPTWLYHEIDAEFQQEILPDPRLFQKGDNTFFKGGLHLGGLRHLLEDRSQEVGLVAVELCSGACGSYPVSLAHLRELRKILTPYRIPLVLDVTHLLQNALLISRLERGEQGRSLWEIAAEICELSDIVMAGLNRNFGLPFGAVIAMRDAHVHQQVEYQARTSGGLSMMELQLCAATLQDPQYLERALIDRQAATYEVWSQLRDAGIEVATPCPTHRILVNLKQFEGLPQQACQQSFLAGLYLETGIRAGVQRTGLQREDDQDWIHISLPLGFDSHRAEELARLLVRFMRSEIRWPKLQMMKDASDAILGRFQAKGLPEPLQQSELAPLDPPKPSISDSQRFQRNQEVAIIGMSGRFPDATDLSDFFQNLLNQHCSIGPISKKRWGSDATSELHAALIEQPYAFDHHFFGMSPHEAEMTDPQQRLFIQSAWHTLEHAGYAASSLAGTETGVFVGVTCTDYRDLAIQSGVALDAFGFIGMNPPMLSNRVSRYFDFKGPSEVLDMACAGGLVGLKKGAEIIAEGKLDYVLVGAVNLILSEDNFATMHSFGVLSPSGTSRPFHTEGDGYVRGEGVCSLLLKSVEAAQADGDHIYGIVAGGSSNHSGRAIVSMAPNQQSQVDVMKAALSQAGLRASDIDYMEAAVNGTAMSDAIEIESLHEVFEQEPLLEAHCNLGSTKHLFGHLEGVSGLASVIKIILAMKKQRMPRGINANGQHEAMELTQSPFQYCEGGSWFSKDQAPLHAMINSFGINGTNVSMVIRSYHGSAPLPVRDKDVDLFVLSAKTEERLRAYVPKIISWLQTEGSSTSFRAIASSSRLCREALDHRLAVVAGNHQQLIQALQRLSQHQPQPGTYIGAATARSTQTPMPWHDLHEAGMRWVSGEKVDWLHLESSDKPHRVILPLYPFAETVHKLDFEPRTLVTKAVVHATVQTQIQQGNYLELVTSLVADYLKLDPANLGPDTDLSLLGLDSFSGGYLINRLQDLLSVRLSARTLYTHHTLGEFASAVAEIAPHATPVIHTPPDISEERGLTEGQKALWFMQRMQAQDTAYNLPGAFRIQHRLDVELLRKTLTVIVTRHDALRACFPNLEGQPYQAFVDSGEVELKHIYLDGIPFSACLNILEKATAEPFDLETGPLLRAHLYSRSEEDHILFLCIHHIVFDGVSFQILAHELREIYAQLLKGDAVDTTPLPSFREYVHWQRHMLTGPEGDAHWQWWSRHLAGELPTVTLTHDFPRSRQRQGKLLTVPITEDRIRTLNKWADDHQVSLFAMLLTAFKVVLYKHTGSKDQVVGSPTAARNNTRLENTIGYFVNMMPLRSQIQGDPTFMDYMKQVQAVSLDALDHGDFPFNTLVQRLVGSRDSLYSPLFQVAFLTQNWSKNQQLEGGEGHHLHLQHIEALHQKGEFDLTLEIMERPGKTYLNFKYDGALYTLKRIQKFAEHFQHLLDEVLIDDNRSIDSLEILSDRERQRLLQKWAMTKSPLPANATLHQCFERQVDLEPNRLAIDEGNTTWSYAQLNDRANRLANHLVTQGVKPGDCVAYCLPRSSVAIVSSLAIIKVGATFVPLDPSFPEERRDFILSATHCHWILTTDALADTDGYHASPINLDHTDFSPYSSENLDLEAYANQLAYVMFTSGSTGKPKGVAVAHENVVRLVHQANFMQMGPDLGFLLNSALSFDASTLEIWAPLLNGSYIVPNPNANLSKLPALLKTGKVHVAWLTAQLFHVMVDEYLDSLGQMHVVLTGGEALSADHAQRFNAAHPNVRLIQGYGPTENTTFTTCASIHPENMPGGQAPIGMPITNTSVYVVNRQLQLVPTGCLGELITGGKGLSHGYLRQPALTAEKFIPHPYATVPGERAYRTGDLVRWTFDGQIVFSGRIDRQVKIRGFRIEPGEIEAELQEHPDVARALVLTPDLGEGKRLVAYVSGNQGFPDTYKLKAFLEQNLPAYMVPETFIALESFPVNANGKIDQRRLPQPTEAPKTVSQNSGLSASEDALGQIWSELLHTVVTDSDANFFELGGHSLLAVRLISRIEQKFGLELSLKQLFENSSLVGMARLVDGSSQDKPTLPPLRPRPLDADPVPLSPAQTRLWFLDQLQPGVAYYNMPVILRMRGPMVLPALEHAFHLVMERHESCRTILVEEAQGPVQRVKMPQQKPMNLVDLHPLPPGHLHMQLSQLFHQFIHEPFNLSEGPLIRTQVIRVGLEEHFLLCNMHHIISDGWSLRLMQSELSAFYNAWVNSQPSPLAPQTLQYRDYTVWQEQVFGQNHLEEQIEYWVQRLEDRPTLLELPWDYPRPKVQSYEGAQHRFVLDPGLQGKVEALGQKHQATLYMTLMAAYGVMLHHYARSERVLIGTPVANRDQGDLENIMGFFVNTLVMAIDVPATQSFEAYLADVRRLVLDGFDHSSVPFERLVELLEKNRDPGVSPLFQTMFSLERLGEQEDKAANFQGLKVNYEAYDFHVSKFDLSLDMFHEDGRVWAVLEYNTDLFKEETVSHMATHYINILTAVVEAPQTVLSQVPMMTQAQKHELLYEVSGRQSHLREQTLIQLFDHQAMATPHAPALVDAKGEVSYGQLLGRSSSLAYDLRQLGCQAGQNVAISLERSAESVTVILAILRLGATYVPMDKNYGSKRTKFILEDTRSSLLITNRGNTGPEHVTVVYIENLDLTSERDVDCIPAPGFAAPAYIMYTSGSTGKPKGVVIPQQGIVRLVLETHYLHFSSQHTFLLASSLGFDATTFEIWGSLLHGARLAIMTHEDLQEMPQILTHFRVSAMFLTAQLFNVLVDDQLACFAQLQWVITGGEALSPPHVSRFLRAHPKVQLLNAYGPTENTTFTTTANLNQLGLTPFGAPLGGPIAHTRTYVVNAQLNLVAPGIYGELVTSGTGLASGYLNRPALTAEKFVPDPFSPTPGTRLYRTGDLVRHRRHRDGSLQLTFAGRIDRQVKLRGFRVELGEIETVLSNAPGVAQALAIVRELGGSHQLAAYMTGVALDLDAIQTYAQNHLPAFSVPVGWVIMDAFPVNANGKIDRAQLPDPELKTKGSTEPQTSTEKRLSNIWAQLLKCSHVNQEDNFFELGGHSLTATRLVTHVRHSFGVELPLREVFNKPTLTQLASLIDEAQKQEELQHDQVLTIPEDVTLPLSFSQNRLWFIDQMEPGGSAYNITWAWEVKVPLATQALNASLRTIIQRHSVLRTHFPLKGSHPIQVVDSAPHELFSVIDLRSLGDTAEEEAKELVRLESLWSFDLTEGHLVRCKVLRMPQKSWLLFNVHHIIFDGGSVEILHSELQTLYKSYLLGGTPNLTPLTVQYADYAHWQREELSGDKLTKELDWWKSQLTQPLPILDLPTDHARPKHQSFDGAHYHFPIEEPGVEALLQFCHEHTVTPYMLGLSVYYVLLFRYSGQKEILVGSPISSRKQVELEPVIGYFVNTLVLRGDLEGQPTFLELLKRVRNLCLYAFSHDNLPFDYLVEALDVDRDLSRNPIFQVMFQYLTMEMPRDKSSILSMENLNLDGTNSHVDLSMSLTLRGEHWMGHLVYATALFEPKTIHNMAQHFLQLLKGFCADPNLNIHQISLLSATEREHILALASDATSPFDTDVRMEAHFLKQVQAQPQAIALRFEEETWTYAQLAEASAKLAGSLQAKGVKSGDLVGVCHERSPHLIAGLLAVLRCGACYVPIDPAYPEDRKAYMLADSGSQVILSSSTQQSELPTKAWVVYCDQVLAFSEAVPFVPYEGFAEEPAYVIYTSGSTGKPKGTQITHRNVAALMHWAQNYFGDEELAGVLASTSVCFDLSIFEIFVTLSRGGRLILVENILGLLDNANRSEVRLINTVPSAMTQLLLLEGVPQSTITVNLAGEPFPPALIRDIYELPHIRAVHNLYGPSEDTTYSTGTRLPRELWESASIGRPITHTSAYVVDHFGELQPKGIAGELLLGGEGLAKGYLGKPAMTAARYIPDPFGNQPGARLYRTGDLTRWREDRQLDFLGRIDHQIKIRGFRVELGEIESVLDRVDGVEKVVVLVREMEGDKQLVAYLQVPQREEAVRKAAQAAMVKHLPDYMVPAATVCLAKFPLTPNGKLDRKKLPDPVIETQTMEETLTTDTEALVAEIWTDVLGVAVKSQDHFFQLGGHSLKATQVLARLRESGYDLPLPTLFEYPILRDLAAHIDTTFGNITQEDTLELQEVETDLPLSFNQERLWFLMRLEPNSTAYNMPLALRLRGPVDPHKLRQALTIICKRHHILASRFGTDPTEERPTLSYAADRRPTYTHKDLRDLPESEREIQGMALLGEEAGTPFDLEKGPVFKVLHVQLTNDRHLLMFHMHHIISDGLSLFVMLGELGTLYGQQAERLVDNLPPLPLQFHHYAQKQRERLQGDALGTRLEFWEQYLEGMPQVLDLPLDYPRPAKQTYCGAKFSFPLTHDKEALSQLCREETVTPYMVGLAVWGLLLSRYTGARDFGIGTPIANRSERDYAPLIGFFANTLVLRMDLRNVSSFRQLLKTLSRQVLLAFQHGDVPFEKVVEQHHPDRDLSRPPLFQVTFSSNPKQDQGAMQPVEGWHLEPFAIGTLAPKYEILMSIEEEDQPLGWLEYNTDLFAPETMERLGQHFNNLMKDLITSADMPVHQISMLSQEERRQLLFETNQTSYAYPTSNLPQQVAARAAAQPNATALIFEDQELDYGTFHQRICQLAHHLREQGIGPETLVGVCLERSFDLVIALHAVMAAGGAYVPLDPTLPESRLHFMQTDASIQTVITHQASASLIAPGVQALTLDTLDVSTYADQPPRVNWSDHQLAYMIYTSGSTGTPKGAANHHRAIANRIYWMQDAYQLTPNHRVLQKTPFTFDVSVWEFFWPLQMGASLVIARPEGHKDPSYLAGLIAKQRVTTLHFVPSMLSVFLEAQGLGRIHHLQKVFCSGEALGSELARRFAKAFPKVELHNLYGPTEAAIDVTYWPCSAGERRAAMPIGYPIHNIQIYVLDQHLEPVPPGVAGQLFIAGVGLARGYHHRPARTAQTFIPNPFAQETTSDAMRLYASGDRVCRLPAGESDGGHLFGPIHFLERIDHQVKLRGLRIELGEIEARLQQQDMVAETCVLVREDKPGDQRLVAYVVPDPQIASCLHRYSDLHHAGLPENMQYDVLEDHLPSFFLNRGEADFVYEEIFQHHAYLKHGIQLYRGDTVFDVGANIGMFSMFAGTMGADLKIYAFEPIPPIFQVLHHNMQLHNIPARLFNCGLAGEDTEETFTFYLHNSIISGRFADAEAEREVVRGFIEGNEGGNLTDAQMEELLAQRLQSEQHRCRLRRLSDIIEEEGVRQIDLLKIDVEKSEMHVIAGIDSAHWAIIRQVVIEVHDEDGQLATVTHLLKEHGFEIFAEKDTSLTETHLYNVYARRPQLAPASKQQVFPRETHYPIALPDQADIALRTELTEHLPEYMVPATFVYLPQLPLTSSGKIDRKALPKPEDEGTQTYVAPRTDTEADMAQLFAEVLGIEKVGVCDDFFKLGGHSLLSVRLISAIRNRFDVQLPLSTLFAAPTPERLVARMQGENVSEHRYLVSLNQHKQGQPLYLVHPVGGTLFAFQGLAQHLQQPVLGFQAQGVDGAPHTTIEDMAQAYAEELLDHHTEGPIQLGAWSMGGVVVYHMIQLLQDHGFEVLPPILFDCWAPTPENLDHNPDDLDLICMFAADLCNTRGIHITIERADLESARRSPEKLAYREIRATGQLEDLDQEGFLALLATFRANTRAVLAYKAQPYAAHGILFRAREILPQAPQEPSETLGWETLFQEGVTCQRVDGDHFTMFAPNHLTNLADALETRQASC